MITALIGCEESQTVTIALREKGIEAFSCDYLPASGWHPQWHLQMNVFDAIKLKKWDLIGLHCPCTYTALCGNRWHYNSDKRISAALFTKNCWDLACSVCDHVYLEQPKTIMQNYIGKKTQSIQPWQFGHGETKDTWLWLKGLPALVPTSIVSERKQKIWLMSPGADRSRLRSKTYPGIAAAIADQWEKILKTDLCIK